MIKSQQFEQNELIKQQYNAAQHKMQNKSNSGAAPYEDQRRGGSTLDGINNSSEMRVAPNLTRGHPQNNNMQAMMQVSSSPQHIGEENNHNQQRKGNQIQKNFKLPIQQFAAARSSMGNPNYEGNGAIQTNSQQLPFDIVSAPRDESIKSNNGALSSRQTQNQLQNHQTHPLQQQQQAYSFLTKYHAQQPVEQPHHQQKQQLSHQPINTSDLQKNSLQNSTSTAQINNQRQLSQQQIQYLNCQYSLASAGAGPVGSQQRPKPHQQTHPFTQRAPITTSAGSRDVDGQYENLNKNSHQNLMNQKHSFQQQQYHHQHQQPLQQIQQQRSRRDSNSTNKPVTSSQKTPAFHQLNRTSGAQSNGYGQTLTSPSLNLPLSSLDPMSASQKRTYNSQHMRNVSGGVNTTQAIALSNQTLGQEFNKAHSDMLDSITQIKSLTTTTNSQVQQENGAKSNSNPAMVTVDKAQLNMLLESLASKAAVVGQLGQDWEQLCCSINMGLSASIDKSSTLNKKMKSMKKEQSMSITRQKSQRHREMQKTKAIFERSLSDIRNTYEKSYTTMNNDYNQLEQMAQRMRDYRVEIGDKRRQNFAILQQRSHETITNTDSMVQVQAVSGAENVDSEETKEDLDMKFLFKSSDLLNTFKQESPRFQELAAQQVSQTSKKQKSNGKIQNQKQAQQSNLTNNQPPPRPPLVHQQSQSTHLQQTNSFFSNGNINVRASDEFEATNKFHGDQQAIIAQNQSSSGEHTLLERTSPSFIQRGAAVAKQNSNSKQTQIQEQAKMQQDHLQVINDSLNSEPATEQSKTGTRSSLLLRTRNNNENFQPPFDRNNPLMGGDGVTNSVVSQSLNNSLAGISEIQPPAMMIQEIGGGWDSQLDIDNSIQQIDPVELNKLQQKFLEQYSHIKDHNQQVLFRQFFALHHKVNASMLQSQVQSTYNSNSNYQTNTNHNQDTVKPKYTGSITPSTNGFAQRRMESKSIDYGAAAANESTLKNSLAETSKRKNSNKMNHANKNGKNIPRCQSSSKRSPSNRDVNIKDMLEVPDQISLQSPLPFLETDEQEQHRFSVGEAKKNNEQIMQGGLQQYPQDVQLADILQAPSLEISLRTATELDSQSDENNMKVFESNGITEQCKPPNGLLSQLNNYNERRFSMAANVPQKPALIPQTTLEHHEQQKSCIKIQHGGQSAMVLQGTIYSDGKSSIVLSPNATNNVNELLTVTNSICTMDHRTINEIEKSQDITSSSKMPNSYQKRRQQANPMLLGSAESQESSLLISEETQANKRTQSSCKKTKLGQQIIFSSNSNNQQETPSCSSNQKTGININQSATSSNGTRHGKHASVNYQPNFGNNPVIKNLIFEVPDAVSQHKCTPLAKQLSVGSRNHYNQETNMYQSETYQNSKQQQIIQQQPKASATTANHNEYKSCNINMNNRNPAAAVFESVHTISNNPQQPIKQLKRHQFTGKPPQQQSSKVVHETIFKVARSQERQYPQQSSNNKIILTSTTNEAIKVKAPQIKLLKKAMISRAQSQEPVVLVNKNGNISSATINQTMNTNADTSMATVKQKKISGIKISNKRIQVLNLQSGNKNANNFNSNTNNTSQNSITVVKKLHKHSNSVSSAAGYYKNAATKEPQNNGRVSSISKIKPAKNATPQLKQDKTGVAGNQKKPDQLQGDGFRHSIH